MRIRSLKQALHWLFLVVGTVSVLLLAFSVLTYMDYAREGYGLDVVVADAWLNGDRLVLRLNVENPGGLDIMLGGTGGELDLGSGYTVSLEPVRVRAGNATTVIVSVDLAQIDADDVRAQGAADIRLHLPLTVPDRDVRTGINIISVGREVRP